MSKSKKNTDKITHIEIRMYRMGTGDCFALKFYAGETVSLRMMIDCGVWQGTAEHLKPFMTDLKEYLSTSIDVLIVTHQHKDHVYVFEACKELFIKDFEVKETWMGWPENDKLKKVAQWKKQYAEKKQALTIASELLKQAVNNPDYEKQVSQEANGLNMLAANKFFSVVVENFTELHVSGDGKEVKEDLEGMRIVKKEIKTGTIKYFSPGDIIENLEGVVRVRADASLRGCEN